LEEEPYGFLTNENFYTTEDNVYSGLLYAYEASKLNNFFNNYYSFTELGTGITEMKTSETSSNRQEMYNWTFKPETEVIRTFYEASYTGIYRANTVLDNIDAIEFENEDTKEQYRGEAQFIRAFYYFYLVRIFGEVPVYTVAADPGASYNTPASSIEDIYGLIISDLRSAIEKVPEFKIPGRADKTAAEAQLAKVYLHMASSKEYNSPRYDWVNDYALMYDSAAFFASEVLNSSVFGLDPSVFNTFPDNERFSDEKLFVWSADLAGDEVGRNWLHTLFMPYTYYSLFYTDKPGSDEIIGYWGGWSVQWYRQEYYDTHDPNDLRLQLFMDTQYSDINGGNPSDQGESHWCLKYATETASFYRGAASWLFLRMSDIALVYAEAAGPTAEGYEQINAIRSRANIGELTPGLSRSEFIEAVWQERLWELTMEGHSLFDLRRTRRVNEFIGREVPYAYLYPLPQREVDLNNAIEADPEKENLY
jgi:hypothetical protein